MVENRKMGIGVSQTIHHLGGFAKGSHWGIEFAVALPRDTG
jgi:hypothetical protein